MPDSDGKLTEEERERAAEWFQQHWAGNTNCTSCDRNQWIIGEHIVAPPLFAKGVILGGTAYPQIMVVCGYCAHTVYYNAIIMGVMDSDAEDGNENGGDNGGQ